ncbi:MAG: hypothetical protein K0S65_2912 [Labilithrix sp.]|nr:hypothetical protein [Labilithrix sp.]
MRRIVLVGSVATAILTVVACASTGDDPLAPSPEAESPIPDASEREVVVGSDAAPEARAPLCSEDGWCETLLPDGDLFLRDVWPFPDRAFAIADSATVGIRVLEWTREDSTWRYIDDNSQNEALAESASKIWAPNVDEVYYSAGPAMIYHGTRPVPPATAWTWRSERLPDNSPEGSPGMTAMTADQRRMALGVWGTGKDDVYAWYSNTIFHRSIGDAGTLSWVPEYIVDDPDTAGQRLAIVGAAGTRADDVWFSGVRYNASYACNIVVRKTSDSYQRIADGVQENPSRPPCVARDGVPLLLGSGIYWPLQFQSPDGHRFFFLTFGGDVQQIAPEGDGYAVRRTNLVGLVPSSGSAMWRSFWPDPDDRIWVAANRALADWAIVVRGSDIDADAGEYQYSRTAQNGAPPTGTITQIRGTSATNIWLVGDRHAIHKSTP